ncbi:unnamed protein product [Angiostrongylus costaricensis]|uniref:Arrestin_C domain-containing protein n=1 Tax=Angiostrongylus costaricensis TaxID=334426 RepID=A0A0R3PD18_ANGCS|nr:unnamed protein product [Angiostrongylus costaricensis]
MATCHQPLPADGIFSFMSIVIEIHPRVLQCDSEISEKLSFSVSISQWNYLKWYDEKHNRATKLNMKMFHRARIENGLAMVEEGGKAQSHAAGDGEVCLGKKTLPILATLSVLICSVNTTLMKQYILHNLKRRVRQYGQIAFINDDAIIAQATYPVDKCEPEKHGVDHGIDQKITFLIPIIAIPRRISFPLESIPYFAVVDVRVKIVSNSECCTVSVDTSQFAAMHRRMRPSVVVTAQLHNDDDDDDSDDDDDGNDHDDDSDEDDVDGYLREV